MLAPPALVEEASADDAEQPGEDEARFPQLPSRCQCADQALLNEVLRSVRIAAEMKRETSETACTVERRGDELVLGQAVSSAGVPEPWLSLETL